MINTVDLIHCLASPFILVLAAWLHNLSQSWKPEITVHSGVWGGVYTIDNDGTKGLGWAAVGLSWQ